MNEKARGRRVVGGAYTYFLIVRMKVVELMEGPLTAGELGRMLTTF